MSIQKQPRAVGAAAILACLLLVPALLIPLSDEGLLASRQNRRLAPMPPVATALTDPLKHLRALKAYANDRMGFALQSVAISRQMKFYVFGDPPAANLTLAGAHMIMNSPAADIRFWTMDKVCPKVGAYPELASTIAQDAARITRSLSARGIRTIVLAIPSQPTLYGDLLSRTVPQNIRIRCQFALASILSSHPISVAAQQVAAAKTAQIVFPTKQFLALRSTPHFYPPENFHFNGMSAHVLASEALTALHGAVGNEFQRPGQLKSTISDEYGFTGFLRKIEVYDYDYKSYGLRPSKFDFSPLKRTHPTLVETTAYEATRPISKRRALVLGDSFAHYAALHLAPGYAQLLHLKTTDVAMANRRDFYRAVIELTKPDDVIFVYHDGGLLTGRLSEVVFD